MAIWSSNPSFYKHSMKSRHLLSNVFEEIWLVYFTRLALHIDDSEEKLFKFNLKIFFYLSLFYLVTWIVCRLVSSKFCPLCSANKDSLCWERRTSDNLSISFSFFRFSALTLSQVQIKKRMLKNNVSNVITQL